MYSEKSKPAIQSTSQVTLQPVRRIPTACVVDPRTADYAVWLTLAEAGLVRVEFVAHAEAALRLAHTTTIDLWVINTRLSGLSGGELCSLLKGQSVAAPVYVIADEYDPADELAAWQAKATLFGCKGGHDTWLGDWLACRSAVDRAGLSHRIGQRALA